jgi:glucose-1-phosphate adenylyltransferase
MDGTLAIILAGGRGTRLDPLTRETPKPVLPFAGMYRLVDFVFSNCVNSGVGTILFVTQPGAEAVSRYIERLRDAVPAGSACRILPPAETEAEGTAAAVRAVLPLIRRIAPRLVLVLASDHVYGMDYGPMAEMHRASGAAATVGVVEASVEDAQRFGVLETDGSGRVTSFVEKPALHGAPGLPDRLLASMGIYAFDPRALEQALTAPGHFPGDFGRDLIPALVGSGHVRVHRFRGYWRDVGTIASYAEAHRELLYPPHRALLHDPCWPIASAAWPLLKRDLETTRHGSLLCPGSLCEPGSRVRDSTLAPAVRVGQGAVLEGCVVLDGATIGRGARLRRAVVDVGVRVPDHALIGGDEAGRDTVVISAEGSASGSGGRQPDWSEAKGRRPVTRFATILPLSAAEMTPPGHRA